jgi:hypothetical protein
LANVLAVLAQREKSAQRMREAITCMRAATEAYKEVGAAYWLSSAQQRLAEMNAELSKMR